MTNVDDLFKSSGLASKRKLDPVRDPSEIYKSAKISTNGSSRHAHVEDDGAEDDDVEAGPAPPPEDGEDDGDYGPDLPPDDDEEGRFFGGGITAQESEILDYVDGQDEEDVAPEKIDGPWLRKTALKFEQHINKNAQLRAKYENEPQKFIQSEADLDADIKGLSILGEHPELYPVMVELGTVGSLVGLLAHENTDIAISAVEIIGELTDEDVFAEDEQWDALLEALLEADLIGLLVSNFSRLNEAEDEADRSGVYYALGVIENLCSRPATAEQIGKDDKLLQWLLQRIQKDEKPVTQNKQYSAEILAILAQSSAVNRRKLASLDAADVLLQLVAAYRKRDPEKGGPEEEYMENLFEALICIVDEPEGKAKFIDAEGIELCLIMLKEGKLSKAAALRLLDHAVGGPAGADVCQKLVDAGGLKTVFTMFMKAKNRLTTEITIAIFSWMLRLLPANSPERIRTLAKFVENDYEKVAKLVNLRRVYVSQLSEEEAQIAKKQKRQGLLDEDMADELFLARVDAGLITLQTIDVILAWLIAEDDGAREKIKSLLADRDETFEVIKAILQERLENLNPTTEDGKETREILTTLIEFL